MKYGGPVNRPPVLDVTNYDDWKVMMVSYLKSIDKKTWKVLIKGCKHHVITAQDSTTCLKPEVDRSKEEDGKALGKDKALNVIFNGVDNNMSIIINTYTESNEAW